ncbi:hypothetical protein GUITHDRAFT_144118 [Guillardia theta CCMP2712]|uniref:Uncharacterized protein n=1 Tax=Guillardia theta (strain CCMP2712) TaxID=905079 RepID=L1IQY8_GUITC|nr:hypothetical protein GUITHDRAFT_144118 [Guillardia theta CCMP2712]EKX38507.1 hypothetical protein GUITHDRAFT_144118 [Guillardia theta CCMP2712]|eukprot:XP_005825487.1 hypothetical protein GUITHDRAFT_144118 [Guillardia theta CCMP2712]
MEHSVSLMSPSSMPLLLQRPKSNIVAYPLYLPPAALAWAPASLNPTTSLPCMGKVRQRKLSVDVARKIFKDRVSDASSKFAESQVVGKCYGVSSKTVRDIWDRRSWAKHTRDMAGSHETQPEDQAQASTVSRKDDNGEAAQQTLAGGRLAEVSETGENEQAQRRCEAAMTLSESPLGTSETGSCLLETSRKRAASLSWDEDIWSMMSPECDAQDLTEETEMLPGQPDRLCMAEVYIPEDVSEWCVEPMAR